MNEDDLERTLRAAFAAQAEASVGAAEQPPPPRFAGSTGARGGHRRRARMLAPLAAAAAVLAVVGGVVAFAGDDSSPSGQDVVAGRSSHPIGSASTPAPRPASTAAPTTGAPSLATAVASSQPTTAPAAGRPVHIKLLNENGITYGVGMPVIAYFSRPFTHAGSLTAATSVVINGKPATAAWYFERSTTFRDYPIEGHLRMESFWPAHAKIQVSIGARNVVAGKGLTFDNAARVAFQTGPRRIAIVSDKSHLLTVTEDGRKLESYPVSLGAKSSPTMSGTKVIMSQGTPICMRGPGYDECGVKYTQRLTYGGEYLHAAPWNTYNIEHGIDSSNGCTNLLTEDARKLYTTMHVGDVVEYPDANGPEMQPSAGYGDWDVPWSQWRKGGLIQP